jgi:hypothetical protein
LQYIPQTIGLNSIKPFVDYFLKSHRLDNLKNLKTLIFLRTQSWREYFYFRRKMWEKVEVDCVEWSFINCYSDS